MMAGMDIGILPAGLTMEETMMRRWMRFVLAGLLAMVLFNSCATIQGIGHDIESAGEGIQDASEKVSDSLNKR